MTREQFMNELYRFLSVLPVIERREVMSDYEEYFDIGKSEGRSENEIAESLGDPELIAKQLIENLPAENFIDDKKYNANDTQKDNKRNGDNYKRAIIAILLIFANVTFVLGPYLGIGGALIGLWMASVGCVLGGSLGLLGTFIKPLMAFISLPVSMSASFFISIGFIALGILLLYLSYKLSKLFIKYSVVYVEFNIDLVNGNR